MRQPITRASIGESSMFMATDLQKREQSPPCLGEPTWLVSYDVRSSPTSNAVSPYVQHCLDTLAAAGCAMRLFGSFVAISRKNVIGRIFACVGIRPGAAIEDDGSDFRLAAARIAQ